MARAMASASAIWSCDKSGAITWSKKARDISSPIAFAPARASATALAFCSYARQVPGMRARMRDCSHRPWPLWRRAPLLMLQPVAWTEDEVPNALLASTRSRLSRMVLDAVSASAIWSCARWGARAASACARLLGIVNHLRDGKSLGQCLGPFVGRENGCDGSDDDHALPLFAIRLRSGDQFDQQLGHLLRRQVTRCESGKRTRAIVFIFNGIRRRERLRDQVWPEVRREGYKGACAVLLIANGPNAAKTSAIRFGGR